MLLCLSIYNRHRIITTKCVRTGTNLVKHLYTPSILNQPTTQTVSVRYHIDVISIKYQSPSHLKFIHICIIKASSCKHLCKNSCLILNVFITWYQVTTMDNNSSRKPFVVLVVSRQSLDNHNPYAEGATFIPKYTHY